MSSADEPPIRARAVGLAHHLKIMLAHYSLLAIALYLRASPLDFGKKSLTRLCRRQLLPLLPTFSTTVRLQENGPSDVRVRCFALGGEHHADVLSEWLLLTGRWQPALSSYLCSALGEGDTFVDVGANTGVLSLLAASLVRCGGSVVAIEACPTTCDRLRTNLTLNPELAGRVRVVEAAAAEATGIITLYQHKRDALYNTTVAGAGAGGVAAGGDVWSVLQAQARMGAAAMAAVSQLAAETSVWRSVQVPKEPLDALLNDSERARARVVKIDVEGGEWAVLRGMSALLAEGRADLEVVVEVTPKWLKLQASSAQAVVQHMRQHGFHAYVLREDYELARCVPLPPPPRPRRLPEGTALEALDQVDVVFSRRDVAFL